ncbi:MAG: hypothetical protein WC523_06350 [Patescibacteria group bacterium]|jgi:hypothetical protein
MALNSSNNSPVDEQLLNRRSEKSSAEKAGDLKEAQRSDSDSANQNPGFSEETTDIRAQQVAEKRRAAQMAEDKEKKKETDSKPNPVNTATNNLLKKAWLNLIPSWGLTLLWINIHVFLGTVFGEKFFSKLGMEWVDNNIKQAQFDEAKKVGKVAGTFEGAGLACLDLGCLLLIIAVMMVISLILNVFSLDGLSKILGWIWDKVAGGFTQTK